MLSESIKELIKKVTESESLFQAPQSTDQAFEVNRIITKAATYYEKVRYLIDFKEEHSIRRSAIHRILKRRVLLERGDGVGARLLQELVGAQYIAKGIATEEIAGGINRIIEKFLRLRKLANGSAASGKLLNFAASEIDLLLAPLQHAIDASVTDAFYKAIRSNVVAPGVSEKEIDIQLYCACRRALLRSDNDTLSYALWLLYVPEWKNASEEEMKNIAGRLSGILRAIDEGVNNQLQWHLAQKVRNETVYFLIIRELVQQYGLESERILANPAETDTYIRAFLEKKYKKENERVTSSGIRAIVYLFCTKLILAFVLELPYEIAFLGGVHYVPLATNVLFHPILLFALTRGVGRLDESNTEAIISGIHGILYEDKIRPIKLRTGYARHPYMFAVLYAALVGAVFGGIVAVLRALEFNVVSMALFMLFFALVNYFAFRIRYNAARWKVVDREGTFSTIINVLSVPVIRTGRWLSQTFSTINVFVFVMDFLIEIPFKSLLHFSNQFITYLKEKADETY